MWSRSGRVIPVKKDPEEAGKEPETPEEKAEAKRLQAEIDKYEVKTTMIDRYVHIVGQKSNSLVG